MRDQFYVYILASRRNGTLYTGVTTDLVRRVYEHRNGLVEGFTKTYEVKLLVYYEVANSMGVKAAWNKDPERKIRASEFLKENNPMDNPEIILGEDASFSRLDPNIYV